MFLPQPAPAGNAEPGRQLRIKRGRSPPGESSVDGFGHAVFDASDGGGSCMAFCLASYSDGLVNLQVSRNSKTCRGGRSSRSLHVVFCEAIILPTPLVQIMAIRSITLCPPQKRVAIPRRPI